MANVKITELTELFSNALSSVDVVPIVDISNNETKKISLSNAIVQLAGESSAYAANDYITFTVLSSNINTVSSNVDTLSTTVDTVSANVDAVEARRLANTFYVYNEGSNVIVSSNLEPSANNTFSLGAPDAIWAEAYFGPSSIYIGTVKLAQNDGALSITDENDVSVTIDTSLGNLAETINTLSSNTDAVNSRLESNIFYQTNTHSVTVSANIVSNAQSNLGSVTERWSNAYADTLNLGSFEIEQTQTSNVSVSGATIFSRNKNSFNSAKLIVNIEDLTYGQYQSSEILLVQDTSLVRITEYAIVHTSTNPIATFEAGFNGDEVELSVYGESSDNRVTVLQFIN